MADQPKARTYRVKTTEDLSTEYRTLVGERLLLTTAHVNGALWGLNARAQALGAAPDTGVLWVLRAHLGTLEKLPGLLPADRVPSSLELLAAARNLFENLVWLKLFGIDPAWGVHFYGQLLQNEIDDLNGVIVKMAAEASLFRDFDAEESKLWDAFYEGLEDAGEALDETVKARNEQRAAHVAELDARARASFSVYAATATFNGYLWQAELIETQEIPRAKARLAEIQTLRAAFEAEVGDARLIARYQAQWKWRNEAERVGMAAQYDFFYRLTSRLLHATPMNIVTEKALTDGEQMLLLEYMVVGASQAIRLIEDFDFPGRVNLALFSPQADDNGAEP